MNRGKYNRNNSKAENQEKICWMRIIKLFEKRKKEVNFLMKQE